MVINYTAEGLLVPRQTGGNFLQLLGLLKVFKAQETHSEVHSGQLRSRPFSPTVLSLTVLRHSARHRRSVLPPLRQSVAWQTLAGSERQRPTLLPTGARVALWINTMPSEMLPTVSVSQQWVSLSFLLCLMWNMITMMASLILRNADSLNV